VNSRLKAAARNLISFLQNYESSDTLASEMLADTQEKT
jgi:hypothetical protein